MRILFWAGLVVLVLGILSFFVAVPKHDRHGVSVGGASVGIDLKHNERLPPWAGGIMIAGGIFMMISGRQRSR
jgi:hypothetical protein